MAAVKKANAPPTHPSVYVGLALATVGLLVAAFAYTGTRVYDVLYAFVALVGGLLAFAGILTAAWGRSILASRASRSRRGLDAPRALADEGPTPPPTVAAHPEKKGFRFPMPKRREKVAPAAETGAVFAFRRRQEPAPAPEAAPPLAQAEPAVPSVLERVTLRCPRCATQFAAEGTRPFTAACPSCAFSADV